MWCVALVNAAVSRRVPDKLHGARTQFRCEDLLLAKERGLTADSS